MKAKSKRKITAKRRRPGPVVAGERKPMVYTKGSKDAMRNRAPLPPRNFKPDLNGGKPWSEADIEDLPSLSEPHIRPALVHPQPAALDRELEAGAVFGQGALELGQERPVDLLDVDAAVLHWLEGVGSSSSLRAATSGSAYERSGTNFIWYLCPLSLSGQRVLVARR